MEILDNWMTSFYGKEWFVFQGVPMSFSEPKANALYELKVRTDDHDGIGRAQDFGFELVETIIKYRTKVGPSLNAINEEIRLSNPNDLNRILELTHENFTLNDIFYNRFKNSRYFDLNQTKLYYDLSVRNYFNLESSITSVYEKDGVIQGYYLMNKVGQDTYKGIMTCVDKKFRGQSLHIEMQRFVFNAIGHDFYTLNATQISNIGVMNNHSKEGRIIVGLEHIFYGLSQNLRKLTLI